MLGRIAIRSLLRIPQGRLRRAVGEWGLREVGLGSVTRRDYDMIRTFASADFEVHPAPELRTLLGYDAPVIHGADAGIRFLQDWFDAWGSFTFVSKEGVDLGDGRVLVLNHMRGQGAMSGIEIADQEEAELWESRAGRVVRVRQWWSWREGLQAVGLPE